MSRCDRLVDAGRRTFFARSAAAAAGAAATAALPVAASRAAPSLALVNYPTNKLANLRDLKVNEPLDISYPDADSPGVLLKLGSRVEGGAGPDGDIVAFSTLCPHKGFRAELHRGRQGPELPRALQPFRRREGRTANLWSRDAELAAVPPGDRSAGRHLRVAVDELIYGRLSNVLSA